MRALLFAIFSLLTLALASPLAAQEADTIDTGEGVTFDKPDGWVDAGKKKGAVAALKAAGDEKSAIEFRYAEITVSKSKAFFNSFHASLVDAGLEKNGKSADKEYGKLQGRLTEYTTSQEEDQGMRVFVFQFHRGEGAWLIVGMFDASQRENYLGDYETMLGTIVAK